MKLPTCLALAALAAALAHRAEGFSLRMQSLPPPLRSVAIPPPSRSKSIVAPRRATAAATVEEPSLPAEAPKKTQTLGLLTFDLDDSLYPIEPVLHDANEVFSKLMSDYGYPLSSEDINAASKRIREEAGDRGGWLSHTEVRLEAIRREMERKMLERKLEECAEDWATEVESLTAPVRESAVKWAKSAVSQTVVESIYSAWERERHHSAERHLYPEVVEALQQIKERHPDCVIGAVTDGKANPMLMVFTLAPYFDFCMSWEDDASGRTAFFQELGDSKGNADLQWIYRAAYDKYEEIAETKRDMRRCLLDDSCEDEETVWVHVGDDLAYDVGGSASCGAKTVLLDLDEEYGQTAKARFGPEAKMPSWSTASREELANRQAMNDAAAGMVDRRVSRMTMLPDAIDEILTGE
ncbi:hypothetical protein ACHAXT_001909 [Thalassiosira profunda]